MNHVNFSSLPPDQEATFAVYEEHQAKNLQSGITVAAIAAGVALVFALGIYFGVTPQEDKIGKDMDINQLKKKSKVEAPAAETPNK